MPLTSINDFSSFHEKNVIQLNEAYQGIGIVELMRICIDEHDLTIHQAWLIC